MSLPENGLCLSSEKGSGTGEPEYMDRLVDVVLSLLAYSSAELPSAPLREAIEALFRAFAAHLTQTGICSQQISRQSRFDQQNPTS